MPVKHFTPAWKTFHPVRSQQQRTDKKKRQGKNLFQACREGNLSRVRDILSKGQVFLNRGERGNGRTPVMLAARRGHIDVFDLLKSKVCNMSILDVLHMFCYGGQVAMVKHVLKLDSVDINSRGQKGRTCLMIAAHRGKRELFKFLVNTGSNVSMVDQVGDNILHIACKGGHVEMVKYIISRRLVDVNSRGQDSKTVLMFALLARNRKIFDLCVCAGCNLTAVDGQGNNILHLALQSENLEMVRYIISQNFTDINSRGPSGWTPVMFAAMFGEIGLFDFIMSKGGDASVVDDDGRNILHLASHEGLMKLVKHILSKDIVDVNARTKDGETAAEIANRKSYRELSGFLTSQGRQGK
ncbi:ankyrin repeat domain-containing protein 50-like [Haliotis rubra]|uniref:ankyrin repeat domain-containing protein 50-like n=1 Tax=Haliotis rubra TaxID=36100 RepID=UPI001EE58C5D|nr:ankyrin repeat domain-containing protein 50-like [Haliotis rubra]